MTDPRVLRAQAVAKVTAEFDELNVYCRGVPNSDLARIALDVLSDQVEFIERDRALEKTIDAKESSDAAQAMDAAGVPPEAGINALVAVALVLRHKNEIWREWATRDYFQGNHLTEDEKRMGFDGK